VRLKLIEIRRESADNRARAELLRTISSYIEYLMKDYAGSEGQYIERALKTFVQGYVDAAPIVDHFVADNGDVYALARMDLEQLKDVIKEMKEVKGEDKKYLIERSELMFKELEEEVTKHKGNM